MYMNGRGAAARRKGKIDERERDKHRNRNMERPESTWGMRRNGRARTMTKLNALEHVEE